MQVQGQIAVFDYSAKLGIKRVRETGSLLKTPGCSFDDCFSCAEIGCRVREEERMCRYSPMGKPSACTTIKKIEAGIAEFNNECQFVNQRLAYHRVGDGQPSPCCMRCTDICTNRCERRKNEI